MSKVTAKAARCKKLIEDGDLKQAFADVRDALHRQFDQIKPTDLDAMVRIKERLHLLTSVEGNLMRAIQDGKLEEFKAEEEERLPFLGDIELWRRNHQQ
jgi:hypothetical protein